MFQLCFLFWEHCSAEESLIVSWQQRHDDTIREKLLQKPHTGESREGVSEKLTVNWKADPALHWVNSGGFLQSKSFYDSVLICYLPLEITCCNQVTPTRTSEQKLYGSLSYHSSYVFGSSFLDAHGIGF